VRASKERQGVMLERLRYLHRGGGIALGRR
jgi:hypothetical protein